MCTETTERDFVGEAANDLSGEEIDAEVAVEEVEFAFRTAVLRGIPETIPNFFGEVDLAVRNASSWQFTPVGGDGLKSILAAPLIKEAEESNTSLVMSIVLLADNRCPIFASDSGSLNGYN